MIMLEYLASFKKWFLYIYSHTCKRLRIYHVYHITSLMSRFALQQKSNHDKQILTAILQYMLSSLGPKFNSFSVIYSNTKCFENCFDLRQSHTPYIVLYISSSFLPHSDGQQDVFGGIVKEPDYSSSQGNSACNTYIYMYRYLILQMYCCLRKVNIL